MNNESLKEHNHSHEHTHCHDGYEHTHEHIHHHHHSGEDHNHEHSIEELHGEEADQNLSKDEKTLKVLLDHWVDHNKSHEDSFSQWVKKCNEMSRPETAEFIQKAINFMEKANEMLIEAKKHM